MKRLASYLAIIVTLLPSVASADTILALRNIRSKDIITAADVVLQKDNNASYFQSVDDVIGLEAKVVLYQGRAIRAQDVGPAAIIERNQLTNIVFSSGALTIMAEGRSMGRAGPGEFVRVMNIASRKILSGQVGRDGNIYVGQNAR